MCSPGRGDWPTSPLKLLGAKGFVQATPGKVCKPPPLTGGLQPWAGREERFQGTGIEVALATGDRRI